MSDSYYELIDEKQVDEKYWERFAATDMVRGTWSSARSARELQSGRAVGRLMASRCASRRPGTRGLGARIEGVLGLYPRLHRGIPRGRRWSWRRAWG